MLALDVIFGSKIMPDLLGIIAGHLYYFLTVLHPLATGKNYLKTPKWVYPWFRFSKWFLLSFFDCCLWSLDIVNSNKLVARFRIGAPVAAVRQAGGVGAVGSGTGGGAYSSARAPPESSTNTAFRGRSYRLTDWTLSVSFVFQSVSPSHIFWKECHWQVACSFVFFLAVQFLSIWLCRGKEIFWGGF